MLTYYYIFQSLCVFASVAFVTLLERKILGGVQSRLGPNKVTFEGILQSLVDAFKLAEKASVEIPLRNWLEYNMMPLGMMAIMLVLWGLVPSFISEVSEDLLMILCILSLGVYPIMFGGWFSGSYYSMLGSIRSIAQMISYEVSMVIVMVSMSLISNSFNLIDFSEFMVGFALILFSLLNLMLFVSFMVELNRTPIDLIEGESELVSGYNTEYFGFKFALVFLSEYGMIIFMSGLLVGMCIGVSFGGIMWVLFTLMIVFLIIWIRGVLPRVRYDVLMTVCWVSMLSVSIGLLTFMMGVYSYLNSFI